MNRIEDINNSVVVDTGMDIFNKFIERSGMEKKSYQYDGVKWLLQNELRDVTSGSIRGGFVADEMGLGKTIMMIGLCLANFKHNRKTLIVLPPVLIEQWYAQIYRTTGHKSVIYHGESKKNIDKKTANAETINTDPFEGAIIVLCSYDAISIFREKTGKSKNTDANKQPKKLIENSLLHRVKWHRVIFDEAHHLRNKNTTRYVGAKLLKSDIKWLVTGTPVQNRKQDFYALCSLINLPASYYTNPDKYAEIIDLFILKRTKKLVGIDLEDAHHTKNIVAWKSDAELKFSQEIHSLIAFTNVKSPSPSNEDNILVPKGLLSLLLKARQSCIYPKMVKTINSININGNNGLLDQNPTLNPRSNPTSTSKLDSVVGTILVRKDNGNGKLVFCHFKEEMNEIADRLVNNGLNVGILDGKITKVARRKLLAEKKDVLILQIQTGCEGLNLQDNYSEIYFVSPHWNPYVEDQAIARCHRIGQKKPVFVWRFEMTGFESIDNKITAKNLEEHMVDVQNAKRDVVNQLINL